MEEIVDRKEIVDELYKEILEIECHHDHVLIRDKNGSIRWKENPHTRNYIDGAGGLNVVLPLLDNLGCGKNSEIYRKLYRDIGYSLYGYWEIFYWEMNNDEADEYISERKILNRKMKIAKILKRC